MQLGNRMRALALRATVALSATTIAVLLGAGGSAYAHAKPSGGSSAFGNGSFKNGYGCLITINNIVDNGSTPELIQLVPNGLGGFTSGSMTFVNGGENCFAPLQPGSSSYQVNADGTGTMSLSFNFNSQDVDGDFSCLAQFPASSPILGENFAFILTHGGQHLEVASGDDFFGGPNFPGTDGGDFQPPATGECSSQAGSSSSSDSDGDSGDGGRD